MHHKKKKVLVRMWKKWISSSYIADENVKWYSHFGKYLELPQNVRVII
jgi:hypothetical protein